MAIQNQPRTAGRKATTPDVPCSTTQRLADARRAGKPFEQCDGLGFQQDRERETAPTPPDPLPLLAPSPLAEGPLPAVPLAAPWPSRLAVQSVPPPLSPLLSAFAIFSPLTPWCSTVSLLADRAQVPWIPPS